MYSSLMSDEEPSLRKRDQLSRLLVDAVQNKNVRFMVPNLYCHLNLLGHRPVLLATNKKRCPAEPGLDRNLIWN